MRNDSIDTLLLRHYGSTAPAPVDLELQLSAMVRREAAATAVAQKQVASRWNQHRVSRRQVLQLMTFSSASISILAIGVHTVQDTFHPARKPAYAL